MIRNKNWTNEMSMEKRIREKLIKNFNPIRIEVINESHHHAGHISSPETGGSHFKVVIVSHAFRGISRVERHRMVNNIIADEYKEGIHALSLVIHAPEEIS